MGERIVIIGGGVAGYSAGIYAARAGLTPRIITGPMPGGLLIQTGDVENYPGFPESISGYDLLERFEAQSKRFGAVIDNDIVTGVKFTPCGPQKIMLSEGGEITSDTVIIAVGAAPRWLGLESEKRLQGKGVSACAMCDGAFYRDKEVCVIGGGDSAMEESLLLLRFASKIHLIHRRAVFRASKIMIDRVLKEKKIEVHYDSEVEEILGTDEVRGIRIRVGSNGEKQEIACAAIFMAMGHVPETAIFRDELELDPQGYIRIACPGSATSVNGVFAAGDCADSFYRQAITAAGMGCRAAIDAIRWLEELPGCRAIGEPE